MCNLVVFSFLFISLRRKDVLIYYIVTRTIKFVYIFLHVFQPLDWRCLSIIGNKEISSTYNLGLFLLMVVIYIAVHFKSLLFTFAKKTDVFSIGGSFLYPIG